LYIKVFYSTSHACVNAKRDAGEPRSAKSKEPAGRPSNLRASRRYGIAAFILVESSIYRWSPLHKLRVTSYESRLLVLVRFLVLDVALGVGVDGVLVGIGEGTAEFARVAHEEAAGRDFGAFRNECSGGDD
jgi:hypothetical protein